MRSHGPWARPDPIALIVKNADARSMTFTRPMRPASWPAIHAPSAQPMSAADALARFLAALGVSNAEIPADADERASRYRTEMVGRRMLVLLLFGAIHFYLIWFGDILFGYAMIGKLAPRQYQGIMMGAWMLVTGLASVFAGDFSSMVPEPSEGSAVATNPVYSKLFLELGCGSLVVGVPAKVVRMLDADAIEGLRRSARTYVENARRFAAGLRPV